MNMASNNETPSGAQQRKNASSSINFYDVLGVKPTATQEQIRQAYIREALKYHPDRNPDADAKEKFQEVANAFHTLSDSERRKAYDMAQAASGKGFEGASVDPFSIFGSVFEDLFIPEVPNPVYFWQPIGTVAGMMLGFIVFNIPGSIIGGYYGNRAGKIRDLKGVSVYEAYQKLSYDKRSAILAGLAKKFFATAITN